MKPQRSEIESPAPGLYRVKGFDFTNLNNCFLVPVGPGNSTATVQIAFAGGAARSTAVATVIVSNDPAQGEYANHPGSITLGASTVVAAFDASYGFIGLAVTTAESGVKADVFIRVCPSGSALPA